MKNILFAFFLFTFSILAGQSALEPYEGIWLDFEDDQLYEYLLINPEDSTNLWNIGFSNKFNGDSVSAIYSDTSNIYSNNSLSWFQIKMDQHIQGGPTIIQFDLMGDAQEGDGLYIEVSYDDGATFENIVFDTIPGAWIGSYTPEESLNLYLPEDTLWNGEPGFSGSQDQNIYIQWQGYCVNQSRSSIDADSMIVRFNFTSDSISSNHPGYAIDNLYLAIELCWNLDDLFQNSFEIIENPVSEVIRVKSLDVGYQNFSYALYSMNGKMIKSRHSLFDSSLLIPANDLIPGNYFLLLRNEKGRVISRHKIIIV
ncbi:MAG: hypothetical protein AAF487_14295 [Bacteroidota bacterium]